ncbi:hypothetical protein [Sphingosinicella sp.]|uniref:hypothetical protein n=1 Tax=Sphingosinicella sp. TaxID=1917971 RepID=UPI004037A4D8
MRFGSSFELGHGGNMGQKVMLTATPGPTIDLRWGALAVADPWFPGALPEHQLIGMGRGEVPTFLSTIEVLREGKVEPVTLAAAAGIGPVDRVVTWRPLVQDEAHFHLYPDSALGAFYDITDTAALRPFFEDDEHMFGIYKRALDKHIVAMDVDGRAAAVVFEVPDGPALYPAYAGFDEDMRAVAVLIDLQILDATDVRLE